MDNLQWLVAISLIANCLLFIGFLYLRNTLKNCINLVKGLAEKLGIEITLDYHGNKNKV